MVEYDYSARREYDRQQKLETLPGQIALIENKEVFGGATTRDIKIKAVLVSELERLKSENIRIAEEKRISQLTPIQLTQERKVEAEAVAYALTPEQQAKGFDKKVYVRPSDPHTGGSTVEAVSYTHLTLPTILLV